jgi:alanyl-tRNA synthetase
LNEELQGEFTGEKAFHLYETFGLAARLYGRRSPRRWRGFRRSRLRTARAEEQARARASWKGGAAKTASPAFRDLPKTDFLGYAQLTARMPRFWPL